MYKRQGHGGALFKRECIAEVIFGLGDDCDPLVDHTGADFILSASKMDTADVDGDGLLEVAVMSGPADDPLVLLLDDIEHDYAPVSYTHLTGGVAEYGGGIRSEGALTLQGCTVTGNAAEGEDARGGGLHVSGPTTLENTTVADNTNSFGLGGGLYVTETSLHIVASSILDNTGAHNGGGIRGSSSDVTITDGSVISGNQVYRDGAGVNVLGGSLLLDGASQIVGNTGLGSLSCGGGLYLVGADATLADDVEIVDNVVEHHGGGVFLSYGQLTAMDARIVGNLAEFGGGLMVIDDAIATFERTTIADNTGNYRGGGVI